MKNEVAQKLNRINKDFYSEVSSYFDKSRDYFWPGWEQLLPVLEKRFSGKSSLKVLDVGCGNGRFGLFLQENLFGSLKYTGLDFNEFLLEKAKDSIPQGNFILADFLNYDFTLVEESFDFIVLFGVLHHVPGFENRVVLLEKLKDLLTPSGLIAFSTWNFLESPSLAKRVTSWEKFDLQDKVEEGDYLLDWQKGTEAYRYCHDFSQEEVSRLLNSVNFKKVKEFSSTMQGDQYNKYFVVSV